MPNYRLVLGGEVTDRRLTAESAPTLAPAKGFWARETDDPPSFDPSTEVRTGPTWDVTPPEGEAEGEVVASYVVSANSLSDVKALKIATINAKRDQILDLGAPYDDRRIKIDDGARADIGGMGATALAVLVTSGAVAWPDSYALGWIALDNTRVELPTPADGLAFGAAVGAYYGNAVQNARTLKDLAIAAASIEEVLEIDESEGWPS